MRRLLLVGLLALAIGCGTQPSQHASRANAPAGAQTTAQTQNDELTVYVSDTGTRYHLSTCRTLRGNKHPISIAEAKRRGYTPCKVCQPPH